MDFHPSILRATNACIICQVGLSLTWTAVAMGEVRRGRPSIFSASATFGTQSQCHQGLERLGDVVCQVQAGVERQGSV